jgi:hypothetical protein
MSDESQDGPFDYRLFGLFVRSDLAIPELPAGDSYREPDVVIHRGRGPGGSLIGIDGIADFQVSRGSEIWVSPIAGASSRNIRLYLLGSAMGLLLHQRGMLPLHANAVEIEGKAIAFMGPSGSGKSTLAAWFHDRGFTVVADDICVVGFSDDQAPFVYPGLPRLRLWKEALEASGRDTAHFARSYAGDDLWDKFDVPIDAASAPNGSTPLAAIYLLDNGEQGRVDSIAGIEAAEALFANTYRGRFVAEAGDPKLHWESCIRLVQATPIFRAIRVRGLERMDEEAGRLLAHARGLASQPG